ncbi:MAG: energy transducer TonB [Rhizobacter sp.]|nr:energy transducer TonB [Bacteriovorax sp.]
MKDFSTPKFNHQSFNFFVRRSTYVHALLILCTLTGGKIAFDIQQKERDKNLELISASVRVDMVAMPTQTLNELKNMSSGVEEAKKEVKAELTEKPVEKVAEKVEPKDEKPVEKEDPTDKTEALREAQSKKRMDFLSKLKKIGDKKVDAPKENTQKAEKGLYGEKDTALKNLVLSGNKLSKGTQMYGDGNAAEMTAFQAYASRLPDLVRPHWKLPSFLMNKNLKARVRVWLAMNGEVTRAVIYQSSGDSEYDQRSVDAVKAASPFPALKEEFGKRVLNGDILLGFPL